MSEIFHSQRPTIIKKKKIHGILIMVIMEKIVFSIGAFFFSLHIYIKIRLFSKIDT